MRLLPLLITAAACGVPLEEQEPSVEVSSSLEGVTLELGGSACRGECRLAAPPRGERLVLRVSGELSFERDVWLPEHGELVSITVGARGVELNLIDENAPQGLQLDGRHVANFTAAPVVAFGGCRLHEVKPGSAAELDCVRDGMVALQQSQRLHDDVTLTTTYGLWAH